MSHTHLKRPMFMVPVLAFLLLASAPATAFQSATESKLAEPTSETETSIPEALNFTMKSIDGEDVDLSKYHGNVVMFVNVASKCGNTEQYEQLQQLHADYAEQGLSIIGIPSNQFGGQEPGTDAEIAKFCSTEYGVEFDMLAKVDVKGSSQCELYKHLTGLEIDPVGSGKIAWNFEKLILNRKGEPIGRFRSKVKPDDAKVVEMLKAALAEVGEHYSHVSEKLGRKYYLFKKEIPLKNSDKIQTIYFFAKDPDNKKGTPLAKVPDDRMVSETKTGMLVLKKKK